MFYTREQARREIVDYIESFYNSRRRTRRLTASAVPPPEHS